MRLKYINGVKQYLCTDLGACLLWGGEMMRVEYSISNPEIVILIDSKFLI